MGNVVDRINDWADQKWLDILNWGYPFLPFWVILLVILSILLGWPGSKPHDEAENHHVLWWHLRRIALGLAVLGVAAVFLYRMLAYRVLAPASAEALIDRLVDRWWFEAVAWPIVALLLRLSYLRHGRPWLSARLRQARIGQKTDTLSDIRSEIGRAGIGRFDPRAHYCVFR